MKGTHHYSLPHPEQDCDCRGCEELRAMLGMRSASTDSRIATALERIAGVLDPPEEPDPVPPYGIMGSPHRTPPPFAGRADASCMPRNS